jgi:hypothetical protein
MDRRRKKHTDSFDAVAREICKGFLRTHAIINGLRQVAKTVPARYDDLDHRLAWLSEVQPAWNMNVEIVGGVHRSAKQLHRRLLVASDWRKFLQIESETVLLERRFHTTYAPTTSRTRHAGRQLR